MYIAPEVEVLDVMVEKGFAGSGSGEPSLDDFFPDGTDHD